MKDVGHDDWGECGHDGGADAPFAPSSFRHACATEVREREGVPSRHPSPAIRVPEQPRPPKMDAR